jgi:hypothetical protein
MDVETEYVIKVIFPDSIPGKSEFCILYESQYYSLKDKISLSLICNNVGCFIV